MFDFLFSYIEKKSSRSLSENEKDQIGKFFQPKKLRRRQYFLQQGDVCDCLAFIVKGAARMYSVDERGNEHILKFGMEQWWIGDEESYNLLCPTRYNIEMVEETSMLTISYQKIMELIALIPAIADTFLAMQVQNNIILSKRLHGAISLSAEERYDELLRTEPVILNRFPQGMVASYLGITPATLSRIKKNVLNKGHVVTLEASRYALSTAI